MSIPLRVLIIEDSEDDALLILHQLRRGGYDPMYSRVDTAEALSEVLDEQKWDIVIADYAMPNFSASGALTLLKQKGHDLPFIVVSGAIGEETAVALMKEGAHDFLSKTHLARLVPAIERELGDAQVRRERMVAEAALRESEEKFRSIFEKSPIGIELYNADGYLLESNEACLHIFGVSDLRDVKGFQLLEDPNLPEAAKRKLLAGETVRYEVAFDFDKVKSERLDETTKSGLCHLDVLISPLGRKGQGALGGFLVQLQDITDRKQAEKALRKRTHDLDERVKELKCLYDISKLIERLDFSWEQVFQGIVGVIPSALQYPEVACARIVLENQTVETENFIETSWKIAKAIIVHGERIGYVEAGYVEERPEEADGPFLVEERGLINAIAERLGRVLERKRSEENIRALSQQLMQAHEIERQKIASDLHDNLAQDLSTLKIGLDTLFDEGEIISEKQRKRVFDLSKKIQQSITVVRDLAYDLHPAGLQQLGLVDTLRSYCEDFAARYDKKVDFFSVGLDQATLDFETQITLYRAVQEGLTNVRKHADAGHVTVRLSASFPYILLRIDDDGKGFDPEKRFESVSKRRRMGLLSMEQRVAYLNGEMIIDSRPMQGTKILIKFPLPGDK
jgi:PAS domain S-box-containing protein